MDKAVKVKRNSWRNSSLAGRNFVGFEPLERRQLMSTSLTPVLPPVGSVKLTGTILGTTGSYQNKGNTIANVFDGNSATFFDGPSANGDWVGLNLGMPEMITQVQFVPRVGWTSRMVGGIIQGSATPDFSSGVTNLYTITTAPATGVYTVDAVNVGTAFQYVRYLAPSGAYGNIAELEFDGMAPVPVAVPLAPTNLTATAISATYIQLSWQQDSTSVVSSYTIERQGPTDGFVTIGTIAGTTTTFSDTNTLPATSYSYQVVANNASGSSSPALAATATTLPAPINPWSDSDIGAVGIAGSATFNINGSVTVTGGGADIWNDTDAFNFDSQSFVGNGSMIVQVNSQTNSSSWAKSGIMIRETNNSDSRYVLLALTPGNGVTLQARTATHVTPTVSITTPGKAGVWLELVRNGSTFTGYSSTNGTTWNQVGSVAIPMVNNVQAGMAVTAHNNALISTATFSNISITSDGAAASTWSDAASSAISSWESATVTYNGQMYVFGGFIDRSLDSTAQCDSYNPVTNTWSYVTTIPIGGLTHDAITLVGDTVYMAGGNIGSFSNYKAGVATSDVMTYDITTGVWGSVASLPAPVTSGGMVCINNHLIYYGGINAASTADLSNTWSLDLTNPSATWVAVAAMPDARNHIGYAEINGIAYAVGGEHLYNQTSGNDAAVDAYNPVTNVWTPVASLPFAWSGVHGTTIVVNNKIVIVGGQTNGGYDGIYLNNIEEYDPVANVWAGVGILPEANQGEAVAYINDELIVSDGTVDNLGGWAQDQTWLDSDIML